MEEDEYLAASQVISRLSVPLSAPTLRSWAASGKIRSIKPGGKKYYHFGDVQREVGAAPIVSKRVANSVIGYARVVNPWQTQDLDNQVNYLKEKYPSITEVITDTGSGLNYNRKGLTALLSKVEEGTVSVVVVAHRESLCRFGTELIERTMRKTATKFVVLNDKVDPSDRAEVELAADLLDVCNYFVSKRNDRKGIWRAETTIASQEV
jgi:predicted site-specific integrase-resolvase